QYLNSFPTRRSSDLGSNATMSYIKKIKKNGKVYLAEVESKRIDGKVVQKHIKYIGKEADGKTILSSSISDASIQKVKIFGPLLRSEEHTSELQSLRH